MDKYVTYAHIANTEGWSCLVVATPSEYTDSLKMSLYIGTAVAVICFVVSVLVILTIVKKVIKPVKLCSDRIVTLSQGDLHAEPLDFDKNIDKEISQLSESTEHQIKDFSIILGVVFAAPFDFPATLHTSLTVRYTAFNCVFVILSKITLKIHIIHQENLLKNLQRKALNLNLK